MSKIVKKISLSIKGILNVNKNDNTILIELETGETVQLAELIAEFDGNEVALSVSESVDIA